MLLHYTLLHSLQTRNTIAGGRPVAEAGAHAEEALAGVGALDGALEAEEGVVLDGALPQVLARPLVDHAEDERVLLHVTLPSK